MHGSGDASAMARAGSTTDGPCLIASELRAGYGDMTIVHGVSLMVHRGRALGIIGPNGSGKSTLVKALVGLVRRQGGGVSILGRDVTKMPAHAIAQLGCGY